MRDSALSVNAAPATFHDLSGKVAVVTGGAGGIGEAIAEAFARNGSKVVLADTSKHDMEETRRRLTEAGGDVGAIQCDVAREDSVEAMVAAVLDRWGRLDILVNSAGIVGGRNPVVSTELADWISVLDVNLTGVYLTSKHVARHLETQQSGAIVNVGSTAGRLPRAGQAAYCVAKAGIEQLTRVMALELAEYGVRVNAICPGATATGFLSRAAEADSMSTQELAEKIVSGDPGSFRSGIPLRRLAVPEDHAGAVLFLASQAARHITGQVLYIDGGESML